MSRVLNDIHIIISIHTETGGITITPRPGPDNNPPKPGFPTRPFWGLQPAILDEKNEEKEGPNVSGDLCMRLPWPGIARTIWGSHEDFLRIYFEPHPGMMQSYNQRSRQSSKRGGTTLLS